MVEIAENQIHEITVTMPFDLGAQTLELHYIDIVDRTDNTGGTGTGAQEGTDVVISTDLASQGITPGLYELECKYTESGTTRELELDGDTFINVNDAVSVT